MKNILLVTCFIVTNIFANNYLFGASIGVKPVDNPLYLKECGSCHFAFQAGLLPSRSWTKMMKNLENHFGSDASLELEDQKYIEEYLTRYSADKSMEYKRSRKIMNLIKNNETPLRITKTLYFMKKHDQIPTKMIQQKEVLSLSNCMACHTTASKGIYSERAIKIPNYGKWDD